MGTVSLFPGRHRDEKARAAFDDLDVSYNQTVVEDNADVGSDKVSLVGWIVISVICMFSPLSQLPLGGRLSPVT
jgi:hypothetical protein